MPLDCPWAAETGVVSGSLGSPIGLFSRSTAFFETSRYDLKSAARKGIRVQTPEGPRRTSRRMVPMIALWDGTGFARWVPAADKLFKLSANGLVEGDYWAALRPTVFARVLGQVCFPNGRFKSSPSYSDRGGFGCSDAYETRDASLAPTLKA